MRRAIYVGSARDLPRDVRGLVRARPLREFVAHTLTPDDVVVLTPDRLDSTANELVSAILRRARVRVLVLLRGSESGTLRPYRGMRQLEIAEAGLLGDRLRELCARPARPQFENFSWLSLSHPPRDGEFAAALRELERLQVFTVDSWAATLGIAAKTLRRRCASALDRRPSVVIDEYQRAVRRELRARGVSAEDIARELSYSDASSLRRAAAKWGDPE